MTIVLLLYMTIVLLLTASATCGASTVRLIRRLRLR